jgi:hypothetical protein
VKQRERAVVLLAELEPKPRTIAGPLPRPRRDDLPASNWLKQQGCRRIEIVEVSIGAAVRFDRCRAWRTRARRRPDPDGRWFRRGV